MPVDTSSYGVAPIGNPVDAFTRAFSVAQSARAQQENAAALKEQRDALAAERQQRADTLAQQAKLREATEDAIRRGGGVRGATLAAAAQDAPGALEGLTEFFDKSDKSAAEIKKLNAELNNARLDHLGHLADGVLTHGATPEVIKTAGALYAEQFPDEGQQGQSFVQRLLSLPPEQAKAQLEAVRDASPFWQAQEQKKAERGPLKVSPGETVLGPDGKPTFTAPAAPSPALREYQDAKAQGYTGTFEEYQTADANRKRPVTTINAGGTEGGDALSPDAVDYTATQYRLLGTQGIPTRLSDKDKRAIINAAAKQTKALGQSPVEAVQKQAAFKSDGASLTKMTNMKSAAEAFETKAQAQADLVQSLSDKVGRSGIPAINAALVSGKINLAGDENAQLYANALTTFGEEYAKIMSGATGSAAAASDSARKTAHDLIRVGLTKGQISSTIKQMQWEMRQTLLGYDATIGHITERMGGAAPKTDTAPNAATGESLEHRVWRVGGKIGTEPK